jgi:hypothetical protein
MKNKIDCLLFVFCLGLEGFLCVSLRVDILLFKYISHFGSVKSHKCCGKMAFDETS